MTSPGQREESVASNRARSTQKSHMQRQQTQPQIKYRNDQTKLHGSTANAQHINSVRNLNAEYLSGGGSPREQAFEADMHDKRGLGGTLYTASGSASMSELGKRQA